MIWDDIFARKDNSLPSPWAQLNCTASPRYIFRHDDIIKWKHFTRYWPFCAGNSLVTGEFPSQRPVTRSFDFSLIYAWINGWVNYRKAGDLRLYRAHYDVTVLYVLQTWLILTPYIIYTSNCVRILSEEDSNFYVWIKISSTRCTINIQLLCGKREIRITP